MKFPAKTPAEVLHSKLGASTMHRWKACPGSVHACENIAPVENEWAAVGTKAHEWLAKALTDRDDGVVRQIADREMAEAVLVGYETVMDDYLTRKTIPKNGKPEDFSHLWIEVRLDLSSVYSKCFGTADVVMWDEKPKLLRVVDYKHGTDPVDPRENAQMLYYALGAMITLDLPVSEVELCIVQPRVRRLRKVSRWQTDVVRLIDFEQELITAAKATEPSDAPLIAGRHCYWCPAKSVGCKAHAAMAAEDAARVFGEFPTVDDDLNDLL